jgi:putative ABC transport system ATP-binding protein
MQAFHKETRMHHAIPIRPAIILKGVDKYYNTPGGRFAALRDIHLDIQQGEFIAVVGRSGSGKSTLINLMAALDTVSAGELWLAGQPVHEIRHSALARWRGRHIGIVFQFFQLLPTLTIAENVMLPMDFCHLWTRRERRARAMMLLERLGIAGHADKLPAALSGGQQQRAAIARALANDPPVLLADEPTGNLDTETASAIMGLFEEQAAQGRTILMATHERDFDRMFNRVVTLADGAVAGTSHAPQVQHA